ncbi:hypothetical protein [Streptomyces sp. NPDC004050]
MTGTDTAGVQITVMGAPPQTPCHVGPSNGRGTSSLTVSTSRRTPPGVYQITVVGTGAVSTPTRSIALTVRVTDRPTVPPLLAGVAQVVDLLFGVRRRRMRPAPPVPRPTPRPEVPR